MLVCVGRLMLLFAAEDPAHNAQRDEQGQARNGHKNNGLMWHGDSSFQGAVSDDNSDQNSGGTSPTV